MSDSTLETAETVVADRAAHVTVVQPRRGWQRVDLRELWRFRDLLWILALRDVQIRYKQTLLGAAWAVLQPLALALVFTLFFGKLLGLESRVQAAVGQHVHYAVFVLSGQLLWSFFAASLTGSSMSLVTNAHILRKIYFPRLLLPVSAVGAPALDFAVGLSAMFGIMLWYRQGFSIGLLLIPLILLSAAVAALGIGLLMSALSVAYRDFKYVVPYTVQLMFFVTPVIFPRQIGGEQYQWVERLLVLNPMTGPIELMRAAVLCQPIDFQAWIVSSLVGVGLLLIGLLYFMRVERTFADIA